MPSARSTAASTRALRADPLVLVLWMLTLGLVAFSVIMVFSSSSVTSFVHTNSFFAEGTKQLANAILGLVAMVFAATRSHGFWQKAALPLFGFILFLQLLVLSPFGYELYGNRNWLRLGGVTVQPSEPLKIALVLAVGVMIYRREGRMRTFKEEMMPSVFPLGFVALGSVLLGRDLGTAMVMGFILIGALYFAEVRLKTIMALIGFAAIGAILFVITSPNRLARISSHLSSAAEDYSDIEWQPLHGLWALAGGGLFGVGPGNSKAKWSWLPAADNDYIFAIIGEELGFVGGLILILVYIVLGFVLLQVIRTSPTRFGRTVVGGVLVWIVGQALVNIAVVLRLLPVLGVPLPLVSSGGTALISCMFAMGVVISITRERVRATAPGVRPAVGARAEGGAEGGSVRL